MSFSVYLFHFCSQLLDMVANNTTEGEKKRYKEWHVIVNKLEVEGEELFVFTGFVI